MNTHIYFRVFYNEQNLLTQSSLLFSLLSKCVRSYRETLIKWNRCRSNIYEYLRCLDMTLSNLFFSEKLSKVSAVLWLCNLNNVPEKRFPILLFQNPLENNSYLVFSVCATQNKKAYI